MSLRVQNRTKKKVARHRCAHMAPDRNCMNCDLKPISKRCEMKTKPLAVSCKHKIRYFFAPLYFSAQPIALTSKQLSFWRVQLFVQTQFFVMIRCWMLQNAPFTSSSLNRTRQDDNRSTYKRKQLPDFLLIHFSKTFSHFAGFFFQTLTAFRVIFVALFEKFEV